MMRFFLDSCSSMPFQWSQISSLTAGQWTMKVLGCSGQGEGREACSGDKLAVSGKQSFPKTVVLERSVLWKLRAPDGGAGLVAQDHPALSGGRVALIVALDKTCLASFRAGLASPKSHNFR